MKSNQGKWGKLLTIVSVSLLVFHITICNSQVKQFSFEFKSEILKTCKTCFHQKKDNFYQKTKDIFHNSHVLFSLGEIDSSYVLIAKILENDQITNLSKQYILFTLKGIILDEKKLYNYAVESLKKAIKIGNEENYNSVNNLYAVLGQVYLEQRKFELGVEWLEKWKSVANYDQEKQSVNIHNLGLCYLHLKNYEKAETNLLLGFQLNEKLKDTLGLARSSLDIANLYYEQYKDNLAIPYFQKGLIYAKRANNLDILQNAYLNLAVVNENAKDYQNAIKYRKDYEKIHDSIWNRDKIWQLAQKEKEIVIAANKEVLKSETLKKNLYGVIGFILFLVLLFGIYFSHKTLKQKRLITHLNNTKDKLFSILTHDLKTPIHHIKHKLFQILSNDDFNSNPNSLSWQLISESYNLSKKTSLLMDNTLHWVIENKNQLLFNPRKLDLNSIIGQVLIDYVPIIKEKNILLNQNLEQSGFIFADLNSLKIILRNIFDNAIKFTPPKGIITLTTRVDSKTIFLEIKDTGKGFNTHIRKLEDSFLRNSTPDTNGNIGTGLGLELSYELVAKNGGELIVQSEIGKGTKVTIILELLK